jgi:hypothetical protein
VRDNCIPVAVDDSLATGVLLDNYMRDKFGIPDPVEYPGKDQHHRPDAILMVPGDTYDTVLDVRVGDFTQKATNRQAIYNIAIGAPMAIGEAALAAEQAKTREFHSALRLNQQPNHMTLQQFVPAAITNMGAPGHKLVDFVTKIAKYESGKAAARATATRNRTAFTARHGERDNAPPAINRRNEAKRAGHTAWIVRRTMARIGVALWRSQAGAMLETRAGLRGDVYGCSLRPAGGNYHDDWLSGAALWATAVGG